MPHQTGDQISINKKQHLKQILHQLHLPGAEYRRGTLQHALLQIDDT